MNKIIVLCLGLALSGCYVHAAPAPLAPTPPDAIYLTPHGCWADEAWYDAPCPWHIGSRRIGYYYRYGGKYYWAPRKAWRPWRHAPPPRRWREDRPHAQWHVPPPRVRDHRRSVPRIRDHRKRRPPRRRDHRPRR